MESKEIYTKICREITEGINNYDEQLIAISKWVESEFVHKDKLTDSYTEKDMDNAYDKGFKDGNQRDTSHTKRLK